MNTVEQKDAMRYDLQVIASWVEPGSKVLDLGCGGGDLLHYLRENKEALCTGIEADEEKTMRCIERGLTVLQGDLRKEVLDYGANNFDVVILSQTFQQVDDPRELLQNLLRIGRRVIVSFPNFAHWSARLQILFAGRTPVTDQLPYEWYNTPNIRVITFKDFKRFLRTQGVRLVREVAINTHHHDLKGHEVQYFKNLRATYGIMMLEKAG